MKILNLYFSSTGNTEKVARKIKVLNFLIVLPSKKESRKSTRHSYSYLRYP